MSRLHLRENDFWRYPATRALLHPLLKDGTQTVQYERDTKIWKLNGVVLQLKNKKTYSKIAGFILFVFHKIRMCCSASYRKKFGAAKLKIKNARIEAKKILTEHKYLKLSPYFSAFEDAMKSHDTIDKKWAIAEIGKILGNDELEARIEELRPIFRKRQLKEIPIKISSFNERLKLDKHNKSWEKI